MRIPKPHPWTVFWLLLVAAMLSGCDQISERAGFPDPARLEAEGKAIGSACRHAGRGLEDCYRLNKDASKSYIYTGWKEMNEYMAKNNMQVVTPIIPIDPPSPAKPKKKKTGDAETEADVSKPDKADSKAEAKPEADAPEKSH